MEENNQNKKWWSRFNIFEIETEPKPKKIWFKAKEYGWGWTPCTWQGWMILIIYIIVTVSNFIVIDKTSHSVSDSLINFCPNLFVNTLSLVLICYLSGEKPHWRWGKKKSDENVSENI